MDSNIPERPSDRRFPDKPQTRGEFKRPVSWLVGRDLLNGLKWIALFTLFKGKLDPRDWMKPRVLHRVDKESSDSFWRQQKYKSWEWKCKNDTFWGDYKTAHGEFWKADEDFWFDYIADSGDGQMATYNVAYLCLSDMWADGSIEATGQPALPAGDADVDIRFEQSGKYKMLLPRGQFLFVGGDTAYHISDYSTLVERFQHPFAWAFTSIRKQLKKTNRMTAKIEDEGNIPGSYIDNTDPAKPVEKILRDPKTGKPRRWDSEPSRPIYAVPGNHDYYDVLDGFNRQFRKPAVLKHGGHRLAPPQLSLPGYERLQDTSYVALHLPFEWWFLGLDIEVSELDVRQLTFFLDLKSKDTERLPDKLIVATSEPTTVFRKCKPEGDKTLLAFKQLGLERQFLRSQPPELVKPNGIRLDLSGDVHHYARYYGPNTKEFDPDRRLDAPNYASVVSGGGGAFHHPTTTQARSSVNKDGFSGADEVVNEQVLYPPPDLSREAVTPRLFDLRNIWEGGYVWLFGMIIAGIIFFAATIPRTSKEVIDWFFTSLRLPYTPEDSLPPLWLPSPVYDGLFDPSGYWWKAVLLLLAFAPLIWAMIRFDKIIKKLIAIPIVFDKGTEPPVPVGVHYRDLTSILMATFAALALFVLGIGTIWVNGQAIDLHPFTRSLLVLYHLALALGLVVLSVQNSAWLTHRVKFELGTKYDYLPVYVDLIVALLLALFGVWMYGTYQAAYVLSDIIFALVILILLGALVYIGYTAAGNLQNRFGNILLGIVGLWHAILQIAVPLLLVRIGDWRAVLLALVVVVMFSGLSVPWTGIRIPGIGVGLMLWKWRFARWFLAFAWVVYGAVLLILPIKFHDRSVTTVYVSASPYFYSSCLPQNWLDGVTQYLAARGDYRGLTIASILIIGLATAVALGFVLSMAWLSWYFAVSLGFNGHNNEVGGAARVEEFKEIVRIRLRENDLTAFVIAVNQLAVDGSNLKPKLVDVFQLRRDSVGAASESRSVESRDDMPENDDEEDEEEGEV